MTVLAGSETGSGNGSGQLIRDGGYVLTNDHVISSAASSAGGSFSLLYSDGRRTPATIVGRDVSTDLAVLKAADGAEGRPTITVGSSDSLRVGQPVVALGAPLGLSSTVTAGIVSALGRLVPVPADNDQTAHLVDAVQTDASINPGNSGGALADLEGRVVGIPTLAALDPQLGGAQAPGIGFAIPSKTVTSIAKQLVDSGHVTESGRASLGVRVATIVGGGVLIVDVTPGDAADKAGLKRGELILSLNGKDTPTLDALTTTLSSLKPGQTVKITVRDPQGQRRETDITLGQLGQ